VSQILERKIMEIELMKNETKNTERENTMTNEEIRLHNEAEKLFFEVCQRYYIGFFNEPYLHKIVSDAVYSAQSRLNGCTCELCESCQEDIQDG
jgi:hypothetical protein